MKKRTTSPVLSAAKKTLKRAIQGVPLSAQGVLRSREKLVGLPRSNLRTVERFIEEGYGPEFGFMHIGKTAGSSLGHLNTKLAARGYHPPVRFGHQWSIANVVKWSGTVRVSLILRDPLERIISGFNSRLRQGRPTVQRDWSTEEAIAFSFFGDPLAMLRALIGDDERLKSAAIFASRHILHIRNGYVHHFIDVPTLQRHSSRFYFIGDMSEMDEAVRGIVAPARVPVTTIAELYKPIHRAKESGTAIAARLPADEKNALRKHFAAEYEIYEFLRSHPAYRKVQL